MKHYIISNYLRASKTFDIYREVFKQFSLPHSYDPVEIPTAEPSTVSDQELNEVEHFLDKFRKDENDHSIVISNPFKQVIVQFCDTLSPEARIMQTVNLIYKKEGKLFGRNIDGQAFYLGQKNIVNYDFANKCIFILGCGGVSTAVSFILADLGVSKILLFDIDASKSRYLARRLLSNYPKLDVVVGRSVDSFSEYDVIYNGTGLGKKSINANSIHESPIRQVSAAHTQALAIDANYTPWETEFLRICKSNGYPILNGFSHMIGFTTLHLSEVLNQTIDFETVKELGERYVNI